ncbi:RRP12-like protein [Panonychus citri]|uniref:RRP12-like protein n=1 Tax=Panonychus citri TaxID=50023 RepID=UPI002307C3EC|nr:RRP12-like protein [Panonychus citri]
MKNKVRVAAKATKGRGNRWRKGESSNCNAATKKFRQRVNLMGPISKSSSNLDDFENLRLSSINLSAHSLGGGDETAREIKSVSMDVDQESMGSCNTFASIYTNCTNVSFSKLLEKWNPSSVLHKEMIAILATITETIKEKGGTESETEYFAILITLLETTDKDETLAAIAYLLGMVVRRLPDSVKKLKFSEMSQIFAAKIVANREKTNGYLMINLIRCLSEFIKSQEVVVLKSPATFAVYKVLLDLTLDPKPKIRKSAHRSIVNILKTSKLVYENAEHHALAEQTAKFCVDKFLSTSVNNINDALHMLNLMRDIITIIPSKALKVCCEAVTRVTTISHANPLLVNGGLSVFLQLFNSSSPLRGLTSQFNYILLNRLKDNRPSYTDSQLLPLWVAVMKEGYISLYSLDKSKCLIEISSLLSSLLPCFESESKIVHITVTTSIQQVIQTIIAPSLSELNYTVRATMADIFEDSLQFKYQNAWGFICSIIGTLIEHVGSQAPDLVSRFIKKLIDLREGYNTKFLPQIDIAISKAIKNLGPKIILDIVPLEMDLSDTNQFTHSWLIPLFRDNIEKTELRTFKTFFLPLAKRIEIKISTLDKVKQSIYIKLYSTLHNQIWSLLPSFCRHATDIKTAFTKDFASLLRNVIRENTVLRGYCLAGLRNLIKTVSSEEDKTILKYFAKGYLQDFITIYINPETSGSGKKDVLPTYETLRVYLTIADDEVREKSLETVMKNLRNFDGDVALRNYLLDILLLYIPFFTTKQIKLIYGEIILPVIQKSDENSHLKKIYKIIQEICCNPNCKEFILSLKVNIIDLFVGLFNSSPDQVKYLPVNSLDILCQKEIIQLEKKHIPIMLRLIIDSVETGREKCKKTAFVFLTNLPKYLNNNTTFIQQTLINQVTLHSPELRSAEILVLGHGIFDLEQEQLTNEVRGKLFQLLDLLKSEDRSIVRAVFQTINLWIKKTDKEELGHVAYNIVMALNNVSVDQRKSFRHEVKVLLTKLIRKFGYEMLSKLIPPFCEKVLRNIRKSEARKALSKNETSGDIFDDLASGTIATSTTHRSTKSMTDILNEDSDSDDSLLDEDDEDDKKSRASTRKSRKARSETFIEERGDEEEIVDLLAPNINSRIHSSNPLKSVAPKPKKKDEYHMTADGKISFNFKEMERGTKRKRGDEENNRSDEDDEDDDDMDERATKTNVSRTSKTSRTSKISKVSATTSHGTKASYKPGGQGIHRPVKKRKTGIKGAKTGEEFSSRKAGGDVKKKGSVDPFAYVPLNGALLNRRKKNKFKGYFNKLITTKSKPGKRQK